MCTERRAAPLLLLMIAGCNGTTSYLDASGEAGHREAVLGIWLTVVASVVVAAVCVAIAWSIWRAAPAGTEQTGRRAISSGLSWIYIGVAVTVVILLVTFAGTMVTLNAASHPPRQPRIVMDVVAHQWWWEIRYREPSNPDEGFVTANEVHLPVGEPVRVRLRSADVIHSFWLPQIAGKTDVIPGQTNEMWVEAKRAGVSRGMCGEYCGLQHAMMALPVTAESPDDFTRWATARRAEAQLPSGGDAGAGAVVFARSCGACHAVAGTNALGRVGPDLTHFASRPFIGAGILENSAANLMRWIPNAPQVKEGARMPAIPLDDSELRAVVAYLETLR
jgi:cytochrome c oxidase subunit II